MINSKTFYYRITDPICKKPIKVDLQNCKKFSDLKAQISHDLHISESDFQVSNPYDEETLAKIPPHSEFTVNILHRSYNIDFILPDYSRVQIPNSYCMTIEKLFQYLEQKQLYFSTTSKKVVKFTVSNYELPLFEYPFLSIPVLTPVKFLIPYKSVIISYDDKKFIFCENESVSEAASEIKKTFPSSLFVSLRKSSTDNFLNTWEKLKSGEKYHIYVGYQISFRSNDGTLVFSKKIEYLSTVDEVKNIVAAELSKLNDDDSIEPSSVVMYDCHHKMIYDIRKRIKIIQSLFKPFYFEVNKEAPNTKTRTNIFKFRNKNTKSTTVNDNVQLRILKPSSSSESSTETDSTFINQILKKHENRQSKKSDDFKYKGTMKKNKETFSYYTKKSKGKEKEKFDLDETSTELTSELSASDGSCTEIYREDFLIQNDESYSRLDETDEYNDKDLSESLTDVFKKRSKKEFISLQNSPMNSDSDNLFRNIEQKKVDLKEKKRMDDVRSSPKHHKKKSQTKSSKSKNRRKKA